MRTIALALTLLLALAGCAATETPPVPVESPTLFHPALPPGVQMRDLNWLVLNREEARKLVEAAEKNNEPLVLFALSPEGFESLALNIQDIKRYILEQQNIILYYRSIGSTHSESAK